MKPFSVLTLLALICLSCKPYASTVLRENQQTYEEYRNTQRSFTSTDGTLKYIDRGDSEQVIVLLHGVPTSGWLYRKMINPLVDAGYRVIVPDMLGYGSSDNPKGYEIYSETAHAERLLALMQHLNIPSWNHVMHDAGGLWTWELIEADAAKIDKLVILNTIIYEEGFEPPVRLKKGFFARVAMWSYRNGITTNLMLKNLFKSGLKENTLNKTDVTGYKTPLREGKTRGMYHFFTQTSEPLTDYSATLRGLNIPVRVLWGEHDNFLLWKPQAQQVKQDLNLNESDITLLDAKHFIQEEQPEQLVRYITEFLKSNE